MELRTNDYSLNLLYSIHFFYSVTNVWWQKYPNPRSVQVDSVDTLDRKIDSEGTLITKRLISASIHTPAWLVAIGFPSQTYVLEESRVNPFTKEMTLRSRNVTGSDLLVIQETCRYTPSKSNPNHTRYDQKAEITAIVPVFKTQVENYSIGIHSQNAFKVKFIEILNDSRKINK